MCKVMEKKSNQETELAKTMIRQVERYGQMYAFTITLINGSHAQPKSEGDKICWRWISNYAGPTMQLICKIQSPKGPFGNREKEKLKTRKTKDI